VSRRSVLALLALLGVAFAPSATARGRPSLEKLVGQTIMTGVSGRQPSAALLSRIRAGEVGGVILFAANIPSKAAAAALVSRLQQAAAAGGNSPLLVAVDQEGGGVVRLPGPPTLSEASLGRLGSAARARSEGAGAGAYLRAAGANVDLAPVLDSPASSSSFLGSRAYSGDPALNARLGAAFLRGLQSRRVAATAKHFPGLGTAQRNTDTGHVYITTPKRDLDRRLLPFATAVDRGVKLVMVSNAGYRAYDASGLPAVLSKPIVTGLLRDRLGFPGVAITDAMEAPGPSARADAPVLALAAGIDVLLYTAESTSATAYDKLIAAARAGSLRLATLQAANARIARLKDWLAHA
jgi:beta-N-acetylhexosaminidase